MLRDASTSAGSAAYAAECRKHEANDTKCQELGWTCIPLAVETFGHWGKEAQAVFSHLASFIAIHQASPKSSVLNEIYSRLNMSLTLTLDHTAIDEHLMQFLSLARRRKRELADYFIKDFLKHMATALSFKWYNTYMNSITSSYDCYAIPYPTPSPFHRTFLELDYIVRDMVYTKISGTHMGLAVILI
eukprot:Em0009g734a